MLLYHVRIETDPFRIVFVNFDWKNFFGWLLLIIGLTLINVSSYEDGVKDTIQDLQNEVNFFKKKQDELQELEDHTPSSPTSVS